MELKLYDTLTKEKRVFTPLDPKDVRMYVCGPTVYDFAHIGNARPVIVFDVLFRLLRHLYGEKHVTYVRNITDVDDKINARALRDYPNLPLNAAIREVTDKTEKQFQADVTALGCLPPTVQPRATDFVLPRADGKVDMKSLIQTLLDRRNAYVANGTEGREVLFDVTSMPDYGALSGRKLEDQKAGARVAVDVHKKNPADFVLWKESGAKEPGWEGEFVPNPNSGYDAEFEISRENASKLGHNSRVVSIHGRPGWHIECSAMSAAYLGDVFDIHGGGLDLIFPHHENEIAQSRCAHGTPTMANYWLHNGFLQVEGEKMSKSLGNFVTINELFSAWRGRSWSGDVIKWAMLQTHYRQPIDWTVDLLASAENELFEIYFHFGKFEKNNNSDLFELTREMSPSVDVLTALTDDLNFPGAIAKIRSRAKNLMSDADAIKQTFCDLRWLGVVKKETRYLFSMGISGVKIAAQLVPQFSQINHDYRIGKANANPSAIMSVEERARKLGVEINDRGPYALGWAVLSGGQQSVEDLIRDRTAARARKDFKESDRIRDELAAMGVAIKDGKDADGKPVTTWEIAR